MDQLSQKSNKKLNIAIILVCSIIIFSLIGYTFAWLTDFFSTDGSGKIGKVQIEIYNGSQKVESSRDATGAWISNPIEITLNSVNVATNINVSIKNIGTINGIVKCFVSVTTDIGQTQHGTDLDGGKFIVADLQVKEDSTNWVKQYENDKLKGHKSYNMFLNKKIAPNENCKLFNTLTALDVSGQETFKSLANQKIYIQLRADIVAHSGNAYQVNDSNVKNKPFGDLSQEFLEQWTAWKLV